jgi:membrane-bound lytic murein transglycosylase D
METNLKNIIYLIFAALIAFGCTPKKSYSESPIPAEEKQETAQKDDKATNDDSTESAKKTETAKTDKKADNNSKNGLKKSDKPESKNTKKSQPAKTENSQIIKDIFYSTVDIDDSASAVDDDLWRQFDLAQEYHWEEAQFYFEKSLRVLANIDIEADSTFKAEEEKYNGLLESVIADYRVTLRSIGTLKEDVSSAVLLERFGDISERLSGDTLLIFKEELEKVTYDIPIVLNDRVKRSIVYFQTVAKSAFNKYLRRSKKYKPMMLKILRKHGLPDDLIYLSLVESGYNPHAYSWARAMGLWQFISSTGRIYGLNRSWWYDERKDPVKSTDAAARFLKDLYNEFNSWELAMAAYNGGPGRVRRTIKKQRTRDFWKLRLKRQTMDYVPLIMAATIIAKNPEKYGFHDIEHEAEIVWDEVTINKCLELSVVAKAVGSSTKELQILNPELLRKYTPPNEKKYVLKIPKGTTSKFLSAYKSMPSPKETSWVKHKIRRGETVSTIAAKYGVSQYAVFEANNLSRRSKIYAGRTIIVPVPLDRDYFGNRSNRTYEASNSVYVVRSGDTMWDIARAFGTTVSALRRANYIERGSRIYVGQKMKIPGSATKLKEKNNADKRSKKTYASSSGTGSPSKQDYKVRSGDTLWEIARKYGTTTSKLRKLNDMGRSSRIYPGQVLKVTRNGNYVIHKVRRGETLSSIANRYRTTIARIRANNSIDNPDRLRIGEKLIIY